MCTIESELISSPSLDTPPSLISNYNRAPKTFESRKSLKKITPTMPPPPPPSHSRELTSPKLRSPRPPAIKRGCDNNNGLTTSSDKITIPRSILTRSVSTVETPNSTLTYSYPSSLITESPGSIAAVRKEQMALEIAHRKMRIAHYGRSKSAKFESKVSPLVESLGNVKSSDALGFQRRCTSVTPNSDPLYVAYHDEEWGVPVHDDQKLFELLILSGAQGGSNWASILRKRQDYRDAFAGFEAGIVASFTEKQMISISTHYAIDISQVRGVVDNARRILEIKLEFGLFDKYIWGFVNGKPISPQYKHAPKIPVKTSKSESISKDMVRRGFRTVGPTAIHSFMQAAGITNDHLITCYRHSECAALACPTRN